MIDREQNRIELIDRNPTPALNEAIIETSQRSPFNRGTNLEMKMRQHLILNIRSSCGRKFSKAK